MSLNHLTPTDINDLHRSGLSDAMISSMQLETLDRNALTIRLERTDLEHDESGYVLPYFDIQGNRLRTFNCRLHKGIRRDKDDPASKRIKYCKPAKTDNLIYFPPGFHALYEKNNYVILTEGEKKAAKAVQEGFPCVAIGGVWNWFDNEFRNNEKLEGLKISYRTRPLDALMSMAREKKIVLIFDSDAQENEQVRAALKVLSDAIIYHTNGWVRGSWVPAPDITKKYGIDDFLMLPAGVSDFRNLIDEELKKSPTPLSPLLRFSYGVTRDGRPLHYIVPNTAIGAKTDVHQILKQVEVLEGENAGTVIYKAIGSTRIWMNRVVHSIDDDSTLYNMAYIPLASQDIKYISGSSDLINLSGRAGGDIYSDRGAPILAKEKPGFEEFFHACQTYGVRQGVVKKVSGTRRRGWVEHQNELLYLMPNRVFTRHQTYAAASRDVPLLPIEAGSGDTTLQEAMRPHGDLATWRQLMLMGILPNSTPTLYVCAALAGLLRNWCPDSENFIVHLYNDSSSGKTTALKAAAGLWGNPQRLIDMWRATDNGLEGRCVARNDMALFLDEAGMVANDDIIKNAVYMIGNGGEKLRASRDGTERKPRTFRLVTLSTGERALLRGERHAGQEVRALEIPTHITGSFWEKSISNAAEAERLSNQLSEHYGFAADLSIQYILDSEKKSPGIWKNVHHSFTEALRKSLPSGTPPHILRRVKHYGLLLTSMTVLLQGPMNMSVEDAKVYINQVRWDISKYMLQMATDQFSGGEKTGMLEHFMNTLATNQTQHFHAEDLARGEVWGSFFLRDNLIDVANIIPSAMNNLCKPFDQVRILQALDGIGALVYSRTRKDRKCSVRIQNQVTSCYQVQVGVVRRYLEEEEKKNKEEGQA